MRALVLALACAAATAGCTVLTSFDQPVEQGAQCGDGVDNDGNGLMDGQEASCADACERCGDGHPDDGEQCDDGNQDDTDGCLTGCVLARCGDGHVQAGVETCVFDRGGYRFHGRVADLAGGAREGGLQF